ncbi:MAG: sodium:proton antiporter [Phycisphaerales bacterium]
MAAHDHAHHGRLQGPLLWAITGAGGFGLGWLITALIPPVIHDGHPVIPLWLVTPFVALLGSIALMPFINARFWHRHYPDFAFFLGGVVVGYYLTGLSTPFHGSTYGRYTMVHTLVEYYSFIALVGGLYIVSGGILVDLRGRGNPRLNTGLLAAGAILANLVGTTGASMLLIRPFMRINRGRLRPLHIIFFIFIVSNVGGSLTPIGDPPLYLGYLKGVPFTWTLFNLSADWAFVVGILLAIFFVIDWRIGPARTESGPPLAHEPLAEALIDEEIHARPGLRIRGAVGLVCLALMIAGVFIDPLLERLWHIRGYPIGATFQVLVAGAAYALAPREYLRENDFSFGPVKEVALLFLGIFAAMAPALAYLAANGSRLGIGSPTSLYFATGALSAVLDNAPTYLNFLQVAIGDQEMTRQVVHEFATAPGKNLALHAISTAAVFFGAMTYIGNGPNFMVKAIAEAAAVPMPSFIAYLLRACLILLPVLVLHWLVFICFA